MASPSVKRLHGRPSKFFLKRGEELKEKLRYTLKLDIPDTTGKTVREQLLFVYNKTGKKPHLLEEEPKYCIQVVNFLRIFWKIQSIKTNPVQLLSLSDIISWCHLYQDIFSPLEVDYLISLDHLLVTERTKS